MKYIENAFCIEGVPLEIIQMLKDAGVPLVIHPQNKVFEIDTAKPLEKRYEPTTLKFWQNWKYSEIKES